MFFICSLDPYREATPRRLLVLPRARILIILHILRHSFKNQTPLPPHFSTHHPLRTHSGRPPVKGPIDSV